MMRILAAGAIALALAVAGCFSGDDNDGPGDSGSASKTSTLTKSATSTRTATATASPGPAGTPDPSADPPAPFNRTWPEPAAASIRPGASLNNGDCTANFVFTSLDNLTVYVGTAAHCFSNDLNTVTDGCVADVKPLNSTMKIDGADKPVVLVYSSWLTMQQAGEDGDRCNNNDFALLRLDAADAGKVSPALRQWGGPTALADGASTGEHILSYGNSGTRPEDSVLSPREGFVVMPGGGCDTRVLFPNPAIPGDSGSAVILGDGRALGVFVSIELTPLPGFGHVCLLAELMAYAAEHGMPVQLATWDLIDGGILPN